MSLVREAQETYLLYASEAYHPKIVKSDDIHKFPLSRIDRIRLAFTALAILSAAKYIPRTFPDLFPEAKNYTGPTYYTFTNLSDEQK